MFLGVWSSQPHPTHLTRPPLSGQNPFCHKKAPSLWPLGLACPLAPALATTGLLPQMGLLVGLSEFDCSHGQARDQSESTAPFHT